MPLGTRRLSLGDGATSTFRMRYHARPRLGSADGKALPMRPTSSAETQSDPPARPQPSTPRGRHERQSARFLSMIPQMMTANPLSRIKWTWRRVSLLASTNESLLQAGDQKPPSLPRKRRKAWRSCGRHLGRGAVGGCGP
jgi:hypothetical protein